MLIKGELEFIKKVRSLGTNSVELHVVQDKFKEVEEQLIRGEKFEEMWLDLEKITNGKVEFATPPPEFRGYRGGILKYYMMKIKEKYFPAPRVTFTPFTEGYAQGYKAGLDFVEALRKRGM